MLIRKNTKAFKTIEQIITACQDRDDREGLIRLYITKAGNSIDDRIPIEGIEGNAALFYDMTYQAILSNLKSAGHQLQQSDDVEGIYFFHSSSNKVWAETPFEFDETVNKEFSDLPDLPRVRKKEKAERFTFPSPGKTSGARSTKRQAPPKPAKKTPKPVVKSGPPQPRFNLKHPLHFTDLEKIVFRQPRLTRRDVLTYYYQVADYILPWLKDRPLTLIIRRPDGGKRAYSTKDELTKNNIDIPDWLETRTLPRTKAEYLLCNDREHLLFWVESGCLEFEAAPFRVKSIKSPDYLVVGVESPDADAAKAIDVVGVAETILNALQLPAFVKTNGSSGTHIHIPLDSKGKVETVCQVAEYLCKLVRLKIPERVALEGSGDHEYGKVKLDYSMNDPDRRIVVPYSLLEGESVRVATPVSWDDLSPELRFEDFNHETIFKNLKRSGDPWDGFYRKKINAGTLLKKLEEHYAFLF